MSLPNRRPCITTRTDNFHFSVGFDPHTGMAVEFIDSLSNSNEEEDYDKRFLDKATNIVDLAQRQIPYDSKKVYKDGEPLKLELVAWVGNTIQPSSLDEEEDAEEKAEEEAEEAAAAGLAPRSPPIPFGATSQLSSTGPDPNRANHTRTVRSVAMTPRRGAARPQRGSRRRRRTRF